MPETPTLTSVFTDIADAIRAKNGSQETYAPTEMPAAIAAIEGGGASSRSPLIEITTVSGSDRIRISDYEGSLALPSPYEIIHAENDSKVVFTSLFDYTAGSSYAQTFRLTDTSEITAPSGTLVDAVAAEGYVTNPIFHCPLLQLRCYAAAGSNASYLDTSIIYDVSAACGSLDYDLYRTLFDHSQASDYIPIQDATFYLAATPVFTGTDGTGNLDVGQNVSFGWDPTGNGGCDWGGFQNDHSSPFVINGAAKQNVLAALSQYRISANEQNLDGDEYKFQEDYRAAYASVLVVCDDGDIYGYDFMPDPDSISWSSGGY